MRTIIRIAVLALILTAATVVVFQRSTPAQSPQGICPPNLMMQGICLTLNPAQGEFQHVVIIVQENRSLNNLFGGPYPLAGASTTNYGLGPIPSPGATSSTQIVQVCPNNSGTNSQSPTFTCPATPLPGDALVSEFSWAGTATNSGAPTGWNVILKNQTISGCPNNSASYWKLVNGDSNVIPFTNSLSSSSVWGGFIYEISGQAFTQQINAYANANTCGRTAILRAGASSTNASPLILTFANDDGTGSAISAPTESGLTFNADYPVASFNSTGHIGAYSSNGYSLGGGVGNINPSWGSTTDGIAQTILVAPAITATGSPGQIALNPVPMATTAPGPVSTGNFDLNHTNVQWKLDYSSGTMNGWYQGTSTNTNGSQCTDNVSGQCAACNPNCAYAYVPQSEDPQYWQLAENYILGDEMFQTNEGPSFPAHCYIINGACRIAPGSPVYFSNLPVQHASQQQGGCLSYNGGAASPTPVATAGTPVPGWVETENITTGANGSMYPCGIGIDSLYAHLDAAGISWKHYADVGQDPGYWGGNIIGAITCPTAVTYGSNNAGSGNCSPSPESQAKIINSGCSMQAITDIQNGNLAQVSWITPCSANSDHATSTLDCAGIGTSNPIACGPMWVAQVIDAIGNSSYWNNTLIVVTWDDWGGWYDQTTPSVRNKYELGFRVPVLIVCAYCQQGVVDHTPYEFGSLLATVEQIFNVPCVAGNTDCTSTPISQSDFNFSGTPRPFTAPSPALTYNGDLFVIAHSRDKHGKPLPVDGGCDDGDDPCATVAATHAHHPR